MTTIHRRTKDIRSDIERKIVTGMIVSSEYLRKIVSIINLRYFVLDQSRKIVGWIIEYYNKYKEAPGKHIQDIFEYEKENLKISEIELIEEFLAKLSDEFERENKFNVEYLVDETVKYFEERSLAILSDDIRICINAGKTEKAKEILQQHKTTIRDITKSTWVNPFEEEFVSEVFHSYLSPEPEVDLSENLFKFPGKLGDLMGVFKRGWLISYLAPRKRGKTFFLQETAIQAALNRLNVAIFSLEMSKLGFASRLLQRIVALGNETMYYYPVFDCLRNQNGSCARRESDKIVFVDGKVIDFDESIGHNICVKCRGDGSKNFVPSTWFEKINKPVLTNKRLVKGVKGFKFTYGDRIRMKVYPAFSANISNIIADLDWLEYMEGFIPDVVIIDYADILAPEDKRADINTRIDDTWKMMKQIAEMRHCAVFTATQGNRKSSEKREVRANDVSWDIRKNDHVDAQFALSQTPDEKRRGIIRVSNTLHRWQEFDEEKHVLILQNLKLAQVVLDSE